MSTMTDELSLDPERDAWLTYRESENWHALERAPDLCRSSIHEGDVAVVFGAASGGIAAWLLNERRVGHLIVVEDGDEHTIALRRNFEGRMGVSRVTDDPAASMRAIIDESWPTVVVTDLLERTTDRDVVMSLADENESVEIIIVVYDPYDERAQSLHNMLLTWHDEDRRFECVHSEPLGSYRPDAVMAWYVR